MNNTTKEVINAVDLHNQINDGPELLVSKLSIIQNDQNNANEDISSNHDSPGAVSTTHASVNSNGRRLDHLRNYVTFSNSSTFTVSVTNQIGLEEESLEDSMDHEIQQAIEDQSRINVEEMSETFQKFQEESSNVNETIESISDKESKSKINNWKN